MPEPRTTADAMPTASVTPFRSFLRRLLQSLRASRATILRTLATAMASILLMAAAQLAWRFYDAWRSGRIELTTVDAPVVAQVLAESSDTPIGDPFDLVTRAVVSLPPGDYRLHVSGKGRLSRTYRFGVTRGETQTHEISLDEGRLLGGERGIGFGTDKRPRDIPIPFAPFITALELTRGKSDLIERTGDSVRRRDGASGSVLWDTSHPAQPFSRDHDPATQMQNYSSEGEPVRLVERAADLNKDDTGDLLWFFPGKAAFLAQSGEDGSMLWSFAAGLDEKNGGLRAKGPEPNDMDGPTVIPGKIIDVPLLADVDHDGAADLIATIIFCEPDQEGARQRRAKAAGILALRQDPYYRRLMVAISGRSGHPIWSYPLDQDFAAIPRESWKQPATLLEGRQRVLIGILDGERWLGLDPTTGRAQAGPFQLGFTPLRPLQQADLDGDGEPELLALQFGPAIRHSTLHAFSIKTGRELWTEIVGEMEVRSGSYVAANPDLPMTADLDDDGRPEIVAAGSGVIPPLGFYRGVKLLDGLTGKPRWQRPMRPDSSANDGLIQAVVAPDLNGDGTRDLITISLFEGKNSTKSLPPTPDEPMRAYVDAISGKDGSALWLWHVDLPLRKFSRFWPLHWWGFGHDGWPLLAVTLGGSHPDGVERSYGHSLVNPPVVHLLELSTGIERQTVSGLSTPRCADLDGDGLADLWGEVDGELRAFRGEAPEAWRALGRFEPASSSDGAHDFIRGPSVDFDGDGVADTLMRTAPGAGNWPRQPAFSRTAQARSGRDGHVIWTTTLDPAANWLEPGRTDWYSFTAFSPPEGDFDGDGTPDVVVQRLVLFWRSTVFKQNATLPVQVLSGRTGALLWRAGPLPLGFDARGHSQIHSIRAAAVEPNTAPDLFVRHGNPFVKPGSTPPVPNALASSGRPSLARISGRDGRILWDVSLAEDVPPGFNYYDPQDEFADLDGDGRLDALMVVPPVPGAGGPDYTMVAVSLREGKRLWSQPLHFQPITGGEVRIADLDGDARPEIVVMDQSPQPNTSELQVRALSGHDGKLRWAWRTAADFQNNPPRLVLARLDGNGTTNLCVSLKELAGACWFVVLDGAGKERTRRQMTGEYFNALEAADLDGDGRDELLVWSADRLRAWSPAQDESWIAPDHVASVDQFVPGSPDHKESLIAAPPLILDGATGEPRSTGQGPLAYTRGQSEPALLDPGNYTRPPLWKSPGLGATVCRVSLPATTRGEVGPPRGTLVQPGRVPIDPRWTRPLPWLTRLKGLFGPWGFLAAAGLAFVNVFVPLWLLRLIAGRRRFSIRALMALPLAAAVPLMAFLMLEPILPVDLTPLLASEKRIFTAGTLAGLPIVFYLVWLARSLARRRWKPAALLILLTAFVSLSIAAVWLWFDKRSMSSIERYDSAGWYLVLLPGVIAFGMLMLIAVSLRAAVLLITGKRRRSL